MTSPEELHEMNSQYQRGVAEMLRRTEQDSIDRADMTRCIMKRLNGSRVVVREDSARGLSKIIITPDKHKARPTTGTIVLVGVPELNDWLNVRVVFAQFSGTPVYFKGFPAVRILQFEEILGEIDPGAEQDLERYESMV